MTTTAAAERRSEREIARRRASGGCESQLGSRAHVQPPYDVQVVREGDRCRCNADEHEPPVAGLVGRGEDEELPEHALR